MRELIDFLKMNDVEYAEDVKLSQFSSIRIGGYCDFVVFPNNKKKLVDLLRFLDNAKIQYKILGRMSNVLAPDEKYQKVVIKTDRLLGVFQDDNIITASAGESIPALSKRMLECELSGIEELSGIPGSIGGAIVGNAGAFGREISDVLLDIEYYDCSEYKVKTIRKDQANFTYRSSVFKTKPYVILSARFVLEKGTYERIRAKMLEIARIRREKQPYGLPSLGSVFKRPGEGLFASKMIDECGLRGFRIGDAQISSKHAGFIVNLGNATSKEYLALSRYAKEQVLLKFGVEMTEEIEIL